MLLIDHRRFLEKLPLTIPLPEVGATLVHSSPSRPEAWFYLFSSTEVILEFESFDTQYCFVGHTHVPVAFVRNPEGAVRAASFDKLRLQEGYRYLINVGSVGQPRDGNPDAAYLVLDSETLTCDLHRVSYDVQTAQKKILQAGLPPVLAERLAYGR
jgi:diadenosine tetraphosphatase ApaH/serine/threonine PP2A family protein phosphatase